MKHEREYGDGCVYPMAGSRFFWCKYYKNGKPFRESTKETEQVKAEKFLRKRIEETKKANFVGPQEKRLTLDDLEEAIKSDYIRNEKRSFDTVKDCLKPVRAHFQNDTLLQIADAKRMEDYQEQRLKDGYARSSINRQVAYLRHGYNLLYDANRISIKLPAKLLQGENVREGFINRPEFDALCVEIRDGDTVDIIRFAYLSAWRSGEPMSLQWSKVDTDDWVIWLSRRDEKTKRARALALVGELREIIERRLAKRLPHCLYVFHRNGKPVKSFRRAFESAALKVGLGQIVKDENGKEHYVGVTPHDMRRSGVRNFTKAGLGESEGMSISGHKTNAVYKRYNIIDEEMQRAALERVQDYQEREVERRKVVPLRKKQA